MNREERKKILCRQMELLAKRSERNVTSTDLCNLTNTMVNLHSAICTQENWDLHYVENPDEAYSGRV